MNCPACGTENFPGADTCEECSTSLYQEDGLQPHSGCAVSRHLLEEEVAILKPAPGVSMDAHGSIEAAVCLLAERNIGCLMITGEEGRLVGILSERDLLHRVAGCHFDLAKEKVGAHMTANPETIRLDHPLAHALHLMMVGGYRHLPLVDAAGRPTGMISSRDLVDYVGAHLVDEFPSALPNQRGGSRIR